jgi:phosphoribosylamine--glycine ligase
VAIHADDILALIAFARRNGVDLTVIGPEAPLAQGMVDRFQAAGLRVFGPTRAAAKLESSKTFAKDFMLDNDISTADYACFDDYSAACRYVRMVGKRVVVKADGLAAGKGVFVCDTADDAEDALRRVMVEREFGASGSRVVIEEQLIGQEVSVFGLCDGQHVLMLPFARDHKRAYDDDLGPNTGGMGAYSPVSDVDSELQETICRTVMERTVQGMAARGTPFTGVLFAGVMVTAEGPKVLEFNCRFGDPEAECILPLLEGSLAQLLLACVEGRLNSVKLDELPGMCATVILASPGYPGSYPMGLPISGIEHEADDVMVFHAGTVVRDGQIVTAGGRVLAVTGYGEDAETALSRAYGYIEHLHFEGMQYRRDIGRLAQRQGVLS